MTSNLNSERRTVLISYSHDDPEHKEWVRLLADKLLEKGVSVWLDQYDLLAGASLTQFMEEKITESDKVILVLTPVYGEKADNRKGGAGYEHAMVALELYQNQLKRKFIPVTRRGDWETSSPKIIKTLLAIDMRKDADFDARFKELLHAIFDRPVRPKPPLGLAPTFGHGEEPIQGGDHGSINHDQPMEKGPVRSGPQLRPRIEVLGAPAAGDVMTDVIDQQAAMNRLELNRFAKWTFQFAIPSLSTKIGYDLQRMMEEEAPRAEKGLHRYPMIFNENFRKSHRPVFRYERDFQGGKDNLRESELLLIDSGLIHYEYCEITNMNPMVTHLMTPITTALYLVYTLRGISAKFPFVVLTSLAYRFSSNHPAFFRGTDSPIKPLAIFDRQTMGIFDNPPPGQIGIFPRDDQSIFRAFQEIYRLFSAESTNVLRPIMDIDWASFDRAINALGLAGS